MNEIELLYYSKDEIISFILSAPQGKYRSSLQIIPELVIEHDNYLLTLPTIHFVRYLLTQALMVFACPLELASIIHGV